LRLPTTPLLPLTKKHKSLQEIIDAPSIKSALVPNYHNQDYSKTIEEIHELLPELK